MPKLRSREVFQSGVQRPASKSSSAFLPAASKRPATMSASICRSQWSAAKSSNHSRKRASSVAERRETADSRSSTLMYKELSKELGIANLRYLIRAAPLTGHRGRRTTLFGRRGDRPAHRSGARQADRGSERVVWRADPPTVAAATFGVTSSRRLIRLHFSFGVTSS